MDYYTTDKHIEHINLLLHDALLWELDNFHTNADLLMADCIDYAYQHSDYLNPTVQPVHMQYLGIWSHSRVATKLTK